MAELTYEQLIREHDEIEDAAERLLAMVSAHRLDDAAIIEALATLTRQVADHLAHEEQIRIPVMADLRIRLPYEADRLEEDLVRLVDDWAAFLDRWADGRFARDRLGFVADVTAMMPRLRARVRTESEILYAPALRDSLIRLRD